MSDDTDPMASMFRMARAFAWMWIIAGGVSLVLIGLALFSIWKGDA